MEIQDRAAIVTGAGTGVGRATALKLARDTGQLSMVAPIFLVQLDEQVPAMLISVPVYRPDVTLDTVAARRANLTGFSIGVYVIGKLLIKPCSKPILTLTCPCSTK